MILSGLMFQVTVTMYVYWMFLLQEGALEPEVSVADWERKGGLVVGFSLFPLPGKN